MKSNTLKMCLTVNKLKCRISFTFERQYSAFKHYFTMIKVYTEGETLLISSKCKKPHTWKLETLTLECSHLLILEYLLIQI